MPHSLAERPDPKRCESCFLSDEDQQRTTPAEQCNDVRFIDGVFGLTMAVDILHREDPEVGHRMLRQLCAMADDGSSTSTIAKAESLLGIR